MYTYIRASRSYGIKLGLSGRASAELRRDTRAVIMSGARERATCISQASSTNSRLVNSSLKQFIIKDKYCYITLRLRERLCRSLYTCRSKTSSGVIQSRDATCIQLYIHVVYIHTCARPLYCCSYTIPQVERLTRADERERDRVGE